MKIQFIRLPRWHWNITVFYGSRAGDSDVILAALREVGCSGTVLRRAARSLRQGIKNTGLTYTNPELRESVVVIGETSGPAQFWNTLDHEKGHLKEHIAEALNLPRRGELSQYLAGDIAGEMYQMAHLYLCDCGS